MSLANSSFGMLSDKELLTLPLQRYLVPTPSMKGGG